MVIWALFVVGSYLLGAVPTGVLIARFWGREDLQSRGSKNIGATNVARVVGKTAGVITLFGDCIKGVIPVLVARSLGPSMGVGTALAMAATGLAAFLGHLYPIYLGFKGGKGVATALGVFLAAAPLAVLPCAFIFLIVLGLWGYISLGSLAAAASLPFSAALFGYHPALVILAGVAAVLIFFKHWPNIQRLLKGEENRLTSLKK
jgi:glycerol-3-phosphate acyltransferase PlsY